MNPLAKKLQMKPGKTWLIYNAPENYLTLLEPLPEGVVVTFKAEGSLDGVQLFVKDSSELTANLSVINKLLKADTVFWVIYPKKSSGIKTDLEMTGKWDELSKYGLRSVAAAAVDATWTALRFRPEGTGTYSDVCNEAIPKNDYAQWVDVTNKLVTLPDDVAAALQTEPLAMQTYQALAYSHKKEYVLWIVTAKQEKTRLERIRKMVEKLNAGKKNPSDK